MLDANLFSNNVTELRASDRSTLGTFTVGAAPLGIAFDDTNIGGRINGDNNGFKALSHRSWRIGVTSHSRVMLQFHLEQH